MATTSVRLLGDLIPSNWGHRRGYTEQRHDVRNEHDTFEVVSASDPLVAGVVSPFAANGRETACFMGATGGTLVVRSKV